MGAKLFVKSFTSSGSSILHLGSSVGIEEPDDVNDYTKSLAHILNFESLLSILHFIL